MIFPVAQMVKNLSAMQETWVWSLGWEDPLEKEMATHSSIFAWRLPRTEEPGRPQSMGSQRVRHNWATNTTTTKEQIDNIISEKMMDNENDFYKNLKLKVFTNMSELVSLI